MHIILPHLSACMRVFSCICTCSLMNTMRRGAGPKHRVASLSRLSPDLSQASVGLSLRSLLIQVEYKINTLVLSHISYASRAGWRRLASSRRLIQCTGFPMVCGWNVSSIFSRCLRVLSVSPLNLDASPEWGSKGWWCAFTCWNYSLVGFHSLSRMIQSHLELNSAALPILLTAVLVNCLGIPICRSMECRELLG